MAIIYYSLLGLYASSLTVGTMILGANWNKIKNKTKFNPKIFVIIMYSISFFVLFLGFKLPFIFQLLFNSFLIGSTYMGSHF